MKLKIGMIIVFLIISVYANDNANNNANDNKVETKEKTDDITSDTIEVPDGYRILGEAEGDLDNNGVEEKVIVFDSQKETEVGTEREIRIYKRENNQWKIWHISRGAVLSSEEGGVWGDPFDEVSIERGCIVIRHTGGGPERWHYTHRYRYQNEGWYLIGATVVYEKPCDFWQEFDYNLSTGKIILTDGKTICNEDGEKQITETKKEFRKKPKKLPEMDGFYPGGNEIRLTGAGEEEIFYY